MLFTDLREVKAIMGIDVADTSADLQLTYLITMASDWIEEMLGRKFEQKSVTEYYVGTGTPLLPLKRRPVLLTPTPQVWINLDGYYGTSDGGFSNSGDELTFGTDFCLDIDQDDQTTSRSGMLVYIRGVWPRAVVRRTGLLTPSIAPSAAMGSIKVTYTAGFTVNGLPPAFRLACNLLVARLLNILPLGVETSSESYQERSLTIQLSERSKLLALIHPLLTPYYRNWTW